MNETTARDEVTKEFLERYYAEHINSIDWPRLRDMLTVDYQFHKYLTAV